MSRQGRTEGLSESNSSYTNHLDQQPANGSSAGDSSHSPEALRAKECYTESQEGGGKKDEVPEVPLDDPDEEWEEDDVELLEELRTLYRGFNSSLLVDVSSESFNTSYLGDPERLQKKVRQLQKNVNDWKESYDLLVSEFRKLKFEMVVEKEELIKEMKGLSDVSVQAKQNIRNLESELAEHQKLLKLADSQNHFLLKEVNGLRRERGMREVELGLFNDQVNSLNKDSMLGRLVDEDLGRILTLLEEGVETGILKLSELRLGSQAPGFTLKDLPLGPCTCVPLLERYKEDLELARGEIAERTRQLEAASKSLALLNEEHGKTLEKLAKSQAMFQKISHEQKFFQGELSKQTEHNASLEQHMRGLEEQLEASQHKEQSLEDSLCSASQSLQHVQELTQEQMDLKDREVQQMKSELSELEEKQREMDQSVMESRVLVERLERAERTAQNEAQRLEKDLKDEQRRKSQELETTAIERNRLQRKCEDMVVELQCQVKLAQQYKTNLDDVRLLHSNCHEEAGHMRSELISKETDLARMLTALQVAAAEIASLHKREGSPRSSWAVSKELSVYEFAVEEVENEVRAHCKQWEALKAAIARDSDHMASLTDVKEELEEDLRKRTEHVHHLEACLQEMELGQDKLEDKADNYVQQISGLQQELDETQWKCKEACEETAWVKDQLSLLTSLQDQQELLVSELEKEKMAMQSVQQREAELEDMYQSTLERVRLSESAEETLKDECHRVQDELVLQEKEVGELERRLREERRRNEGNMGKLEGQLELEKLSREDEADRHLKRISEMREELKKTRDLENELEDGQVKYKRLQQLLDDREKVIQQLQNETGYLDTVHKYTKQEVEHGQKLVEFLQEDLASSKGHCDGLHLAVSDYEEKLEAMAEQLRTQQHMEQSLQDQLSQSERSRIVLDLAGTERLSEIHSLSREVEELRMKADLVKELRERVDELEQELIKKQAETESVRVKLLAVEYSHTDILQQLNRRAAESEREGEDVALHLVIEEQEKEIHLLREQCVILGNSLEETHQTSKGDIDLSNNGIDDNTYFQRIREMETELISLGTAHDHLNTRNDMLVEANSELKFQLENLLSTQGVASDSPNGSKPSCLSLSVNVDISNLPPSTTTSLTTSSNAVGMVYTTVPVRCSSYRRTMENGLLMAPVVEDVHFGGSETESEAATLDKDYWVQRAGELSTQLQQSSEYWSSKVRELSIELEKQRQAPQHSEED